jgi:hypothetical protein
MEQPQLVSRIRESFKERGTSLFRRLYDNETQTRVEVEEGDITLCRHFARLFNGNAGLIEAAFKTSARFDRVVWKQNELFSGMTYGQRVVACAVGKKPKMRKFLHAESRPKPLYDARFNS